MRLSGSCPSIKLLTLVCITSTEKLGNQLAIWEPFKEKTRKVWCTSHEEYSFICFSQKKPVLIKHFQQTSCIRILRKVDNFNFERTGSHTHVVVQFNPWFKFYFPLFFWYGNVLDKSYMYRLENTSHNEIHMMAESRYVVLIYMTKGWCMLHPRRTSGLQTDLFFYLIRSSRMII